MSRNGKPPQRQRILDDLRHAQPHAVCSVRWIQDYMPRFASPICVLRKEGYIIIGERCDQHNHEGGVFMYRLVREPGAAAPQQQLRWLG